MGRVVGVTLIVLGLWVFYSVYAYFRHGTEFRLRSRWMLVFSWMRYSWRWFGAKLHGHDHVEPVEMSAYGSRTAFGVGMIHGVGAETGSQVLIIAAVGGAASVGLGIPMMLAFIVGLLISNSVIVVLSATGFVASQTRSRLYLAIGILAATVQPDRRDLVRHAGRRRPAGSQRDLQLHRGRLLGDREPTGRRRQLGAGAGVEAGASGPRWGRRYRGSTTTR